MKKLIIAALALVGLYYASVIVVAELSERRAEKYIAFLLPEIARPWSAKQIRFYGTKWLNNESKTTPEEMVTAIEIALGPFQKILKGPNCIFKGSRFPGETRQTVWAICDVTARYQKATAKLKIRLVEEPRQPAEFFRVFGDSLKINDFSDLEIVE